MLRNYSLLFLSFTTLAFVSCEKEVDFEFNKKESLVVVSHFTESNKLDALVYKTKSVDSNEPTEFLTDATVMVFSGGEFLEVLELVPANDANQTPPFYRSKDLQPEIGKVYVIKVTVPGFEPVTAESSIPVAVPIQSVQFSNNIAEDGNQDIVLDFDVSVSIQDPRGIKNYYHLIFYQEIIPFVVTEGGDTIRGNVSYAKPLELAPGDQSLIMKKHYDNRSFIIEDETFDGEQMTFSAFGKFSYNPKKYIPGDFLVELRTVSEAYYFHYSTLIQQNAAGGNPLSEGVVIYDNIENGVGIFAGYSTSVNAFRLGN